MSDPLSIAASIAGLIVLTEELFQLICKFKDAKKEIQSLSKEIRSLSVLLYDLSLLARSFEADKLDVYFRLHHVNACRETVQDAKSRLEKAAGRLKGGRTRAVGTKLKWPYTSKEVQKLLEDISRYKETMILALSADSMKGMLQALSKQEEMSDSIDHIQQTLNQIQTRITLDKQRSDVLGFFMRYNPQPHLEMSLSLRHPLTGLWLTEGSEFKDWADSQNGKLWLSGIPGAGKTVLAGLMIEECLKRSWYGASTGATCFFFCDYKEPRSQDVTTILGCLASQLARQNTDAFETLAAYYADLHPENGLPKSPSPAALLEVLTDMSENFDQVLMVVDGLDECGLDSSLTRDLRSLVENVPSISMAVLGRPEQHIVEELEGLFSHVEIAAQSADVQLYVRAELRERIQKRKLRIRRAALEGEIIQALLDGAQGMFRWVSCQLDYICELPTDTDRKAALGKLPPTLNATYQRILNDTRPESMHIMQTALRLIAIAGPEITILQLCDALSLRDGEVSIDEDDVLDEEEIARICRSLIRKSNDKTHFEFAHFTVREFLESSSLLDTPLEIYHIASAGTWFLIDFCLRFLRLENFSNSLYSPIEILQALEDIDQDHPFYHFATWKWPFIFRTNFACLRGSSEQQSSVSDTLVEAVLQQIDELFHADKSSHFLLWSANLSLIYRRSTEICGNPESILPELIHANFTPLHMTSILTLEYPTVKFIELEPSAPAPRSSFPSPAECLLLGMPALLYDIPEDIDSQIFAEPEVNLLIVDWMGPSTSRDIWGDLLKRLPVSPLLELKQVKFGPSRYSLLDLICERGRELFRWAQDFLYFMRPGAELNESIVSTMQNLIGDYQWPSDKANQEGVLLSALRGIYQKTADVFQEDNLVFVLRQLVVEIEIMGETSPEKALCLEVGALEDREYDSATELAISYDNIDRLHQLSADQRLQTYPDREASGRSFLHLAAHLGSVRALEKLLTYGLDPSLQDHDGHTALHLADANCMETLMKYGTSDAVRDNEDNTVWHLEAQRGTPISVWDTKGSIAWRSRMRGVSGINILLDMSSDPAGRLIEVNDEGYTPMALTLSKGIKEHATLLLPHCHTVEAFAGPRPVYEAAMKAGMDDVIEGLMAANIPVDEGSFPIHRTNSRSSVRCLQLLKSLCPWARDQRHNRHLPLENVLKGLLYFEGPIEKELIVELIPVLELHKAECLEYLCRRIVPWLGPLGSGADIENDEVSLALKEVLEVFLDHGVCEAYERHHKRPVTQLLTDILLSRVGKPELGWDRIESLDSTMVKVLKGSRLQAKADMSSLLRLSVYAGWKNVMGELLATGNGVDENNNQLCLELACLPFNRCSLTTFDLLLSKADVNRLNQLNQTSELALVHLLSNQDVPGRMEKLSKLLEKGADPDTRARAESQPALVYHILASSSQTVKILLQNNANPQLVDEDGFNALISMVWVDDLESLRALHKIAQDTDWKQTITIRPHFGDSSSCSRLLTEIEVPQCNPLHVAAAVGSLNCLKYLVEEDLVADVSAKAGLGYTCAHFAATLNSPVGRDIFQYLMSKACDVNALNDLQETPLDSAVQCNIPKGNIEILVNLGAKPAGINPMKLIQDDNMNGQGRLELLEPDALPRVYDAELITKRRLQLLAKAIEVGDLATCKRLHSQRCPLTTALPNQKGIPIVCAITHKRTAIIRWLLETGGGQWAHSPGLPPVGLIQFALRFPECNSVLKALILHFEFIWHEWLIGGHTAFDATISWSNMDGLEIMLECLAGIDRERRMLNPSGIPNLCDVLNARQMNPPLHSAALRDNVEAIKVLLRYGASIDVIDMDGHCALHRAIVTKSHNVVRYLLEKGCMHNIFVYRHGIWLGGTPLDYALRGADVEVVELLLSYMKPLDRMTPGISPFIDSTTPATFAVLLGHGLDFPSNIWGKQEILFQALIRPNFRSYILQSCFITDLRLDEHEIPVIYRHGLLPIIPQILRVLGRATMQTMLPTEPQDTESPLCTAAGQGLINSCRALISMGADLEFEGHSLGTPLMVACALRRIDVVKFLVRDGAKLAYLSTRSQDWKCALSVAEDCLEICRWILVGQYTDQARISLQSHRTSPQEISWWSGGGQVEIPLIGVRERRYNESLLDHVVRLGRIRLWLRGKTVPCPVTNNALF